MKGWYLMNIDEITLQQYQMYSEQKDKFIDRSFTTNKFYLLLILAIILTMLLTKDYSFIYGLTSTLIFSAIGMGVCLLWWINIDSYNFLIKIKLSKVLEQLEKRLPAQPYGLEFSAINDYKKNKREFLFADIQKGLSIAILLLFLVLFINEVLVAILT